MEEKFREGVSTDYCRGCERDTNWTLIERVFHYIWKCLACGAERVAASRVSQRSRLDTRFTI